MRKSILVEKLWMEDKEFVTNKELKQYCKVLKLDYSSVIHYLLKWKYLIRIFRGIFYVKSLEEFKLGKSKYNHLQFVAKGLELKGVKNWYFGLHTALKLNNMTHEHFVIEEVISDSLFRSKPTSIAGYKFKFVKISSSLLDFGIKQENTMLRYSDPEKTILDFIYLYKQDGIPADKIVIDISSWSNNISTVKFKKYSKRYPKTVWEIANRVIR